MGSCLYSPPHSLGRNVMQKGRVTAANVSSDTDDKIAMGLPLAVRIMSRSSGSCFQTSLGLLLRFRTVMNFMAVRPDDQMVFDCHSPVKGRRGKAVRHGGARDGAHAPPLIASVLNTKTTLQVV